MKVETDVRLTGEQVRQLRKSRGWTIQQLADMTGVSPRALGDFERGARQLHQVNYDAVAEVLVVPGDPAETRARWPEDIGLFLDILGAFLAALPTEERAGEMRRMFADIGARRRSDT